MAAMFGLMVWHAHRRLAADTVSARVSDENARLLATQRRFLQDASHQLSTPITIALGHAELLAGELAGRPGGGARHRRGRRRAGPAPAAQRAAADDRRRGEPRLPPSRAGRAGPLHRGRARAGGQPPNGAGSSGGSTRSWWTPTGSGWASPWTPCWRTRSSTPPRGDVIRLSVLAAEDRVRRPHDHRRRRHGDPPLRVALTSSTGSGPGRRATGPATRGTGLGLALVRAVAPGTAARRGCTARRARAVQFEFVLPADGRPKARPSARAARVPAAPPRRAIRSRT